MNPLLLAAMLGTNTPVDLCRSVHAWESGNGAYQIPVVEGAPNRGMIDEFLFLATEVTNAANPRISCTVNLAIYTNLCDLQFTGSTPAQVTPIWYKQFDTNNGLTLTAFDPQTIGTNCLDAVTNVWLVRLPVHTIVPAGTWITFWFPPNHLSWKVPPYQPYIGGGGIVRVYQSCRFTKPAGGFGYYCKPLAEVMRAYDLPYFTIFRPALSATLAPGPSITVSTGVPTPLLLRTGTHVISITNTVNLKADKPSEIFWLESN